MTGEYLLMLASRWLHILSAALAIGAPLYVRFVLMPAMMSLDAENRGRLSEAVARRWRIIVHLLIVIFLVTGFYNFLGVARWKKFPPDEKFQYHLLFGIKLVIALAMFTISSGLAGRSKLFAPMRERSRLWLTILIALGVAILGISGTMRHIQ